jgi:hypothetical protein
VNERLVISLGADGRVRAHTEGMLGTKCLAAVPVLEDLLDAVVIDSSYTSDFNVQSARGRSVTDTDQQQETKP